MPVDSTIITDSVSTIDNTTSVDSTVSDLTTTSITINELEPYLKQYDLDLTFTNGLLTFLIVYIVIRDVSRFIKSFISGGMV